jgi:hypothetical protein
MPAPKVTHFNAFTLAANGLADRLITPLRISQASTEKIDDTEFQRLLSTSETASGLWDTGATGSCVTPSMARKLNLVPVGVGNMTHAGGIRQSNKYLVDLFLPNNVHVPGVLVMELEDGMSFDVIIGMDIISRGDFSITNSEGKTTMSFRIPSVQCIDYVREANRILGAGLSRNDPCYCGSGKKYKHCHGMQ